MNKRHIRSYTVGSGGDLTVISIAKDAKTGDLSTNYTEIPRNRRLLREDAHLDVFRYENGDLGWTATANGHDTPAAMSLGLLIQAYAEDLELAEGSSPRAF